MGSKSLASGLWSLFCSFFKQLPLPWLIVSLMLIAGKFAGMSEERILVELRSALGDMNAQAEVARSFEAQAGDEVLSKPNRSAYIYIGGFKYNKALAARYLDLIRARLEAMPGPVAPDSVEEGKPGKSYFIYLAVDAAETACKLASEGDLSGLRMREYMLTNKEYGHCVDAWRRRYHENILVTAFSTGGPSVELATCIILIARADKADPFARLNAAGFDQNSGKVSQALARAERIAKRRLDDSAWANDYPWTLAKAWEATWKSCLIVIFAWGIIHGIAMQINGMALLWANWLRPAAIPVMYLLSPLVFLACYDVQFGLRHPSRIPDLPILVCAQAGLIVLLLCLTHRHISNRISELKVSDI